MASKSRMAQRANIASIDPIWAELRQEAEEAVRNEPALGHYHRSLRDTLGLNPS